MNRPPAFSKSIRAWLAGWLSIFRATACCGGTRHSACRRRSRCRRRCCVDPQHDPDLRVIERASARPGQGISSTFKFGAAYGALRAVAAALGVPTRIVAPTTWKRHWRLRTKNKPALLPSTYGRASITSPARRITAGPRRRYSRATPPRRFSRVCRHERSEPANRGGSRHSEASRNWLSRRTRARPAIRASTNRYRGRWRGASFADPLGTAAYASEAPRACRRATGPRRNVSHVRPIGKLQDFCRHGYQRSCRTWLGMVWIRCRSRWSTLHCARGRARARGKIDRLPCSLRSRRSDRRALYVVPEPIDLCRSTADADLLLKRIAELPTLSLIVVDTLSRAMSGGNENSPEDMGKFVTNCDRIRIASGAHLMVIHHTGKDDAKGARGHSLLRAAADTEIEVSREQREPSRLTSQSSAIVSPDKPMPSACRRWISARTKRARRHKRRHRPYRSEAGKKGARACQDHQGCHHGTSRSPSRPRRGGSDTASLKPYSDRNFDRHNRAVARFRLPHGDISRRHYRSRQTGRLPTGIRKPDRRGKSCSLGTVIWLT